MFLSISTNVHGVYGRLFQKKCGYQMPALWEHDFHSIYGETNEIAVSLFPCGSILMGAYCYWWIVFILNLLLLLSFFVPCSFTFLKCIEREVCFIHWLTLQIPSTAEAGPGRSQRAGNSVWISYVCSRDASTSAITVALQGAFMEFRYSKVAFNHCTQCLPHMSCF